MLNDPRKLVLLLAAVVGWSKPAQAQEFLGKSTTAQSPSDAQFLGNPPLYQYYSGLQQAKHEYEQALPPDPFGIERFHQPTPVRGAHFTGDNYSLNTRPDTPTMGIRLDTTYSFLRETNVMVAMSEHQTVVGAGATLLPIQTPCWLIGVRALGVYADNQTMIEDEPGASFDLFFGTRYKTVYMKVGALWDNHDDFQKVGATGSLLTKVPLLGVVTVDTAFGLGTGGPDFFPMRDPRFNIRQRRVEVANYEHQIRIGKFWTENVQFGFTSNYLEFEGALDEWGAGAFANLYMGRFTLGLDITGGDEGLRGYVNLAYRWGAGDADRPRDCRLMPIDTVSWITRATDRDISVRLRESFTGPLRPFPPGIAGGAH